MNLLSTKSKQTERVQLVSTLSKRRKFVRHVEATFHFFERIVRLAAFDNVASTLLLVCGRGFKTLKSDHITPVLRFLHWLNITERILCKLLSRNPFNNATSKASSSSSFVTVARPPTSSSLKVTDHSLCYASPCLWNQLHL